MSQDRFEDRSEDKSGPGAAPHTSQLSLPLKKDQAYRLVDAVMERDDLALSATAREDENGEWVFEALCGERPDVEAFNVLARQVLGGDISFEIDALDDSIDWVAKSLEGLKPVSAGGFYIYGAHNGDRIPAGLTPIHIEAAQAFGTGHHETTTGCLVAINEILKRRPPEFMLDVGTGTGVLAIALAKRTRSPVIATDIDPVSVTTTLQNARANGVGGQIIAVEADGLTNRIVWENAPYDLIVANILAQPLRELAPEIGQAAAGGGHIVLSGILRTQAARIIATYRQQRFALVRRIERGDWSTLVFKKQ